MAILTVDIGGVPHYYHSSVVMEANTSDDRVLGTVVTVTNTAGAVLTPMDVDTLSPLSPFQSSPINGVVPPCYLPVLVANYDAGGDAQYSSKSPYLEDLAEQVAALVAEAAASKVAAEAAQADAAATRAEVQALIEGASFLSAPNANGARLWWVRGDADDPTDDDVTSDDIVIDKRLVP